MAHEPPLVRTAEINALCMEIAELVGALGSASALSTSPVLHRELRITTIHSSLMIEGNTLSREAVTAILDGRRVLGPARQILEVDNARRAYRLMDDLDPLSPDDLLRAHGVMMRGLIDDAGRYRAGNTGVFEEGGLIHAGTPARCIPEVMTDLFAWMTSTDLHPLTASCVFHYEFEFIHPFSDGNGRTGRLWHTLLLSHWRPALAWLPIESVIRDRQEGYYEAIARSNARGSSEAFVAFMLTVIRDALAPYATVSSARNRREQVLSFLDANPNATIKALAEHLGCSRRTAERAVAALRGSGRLVREGSARAGTWRVIADGGASGP